MRRFLFYFPIVDIFTFIEQSFRVIFTSRTEFPCYFHNKCRGIFCYFPSWTYFLQYFLDIFTFIEQSFRVIFTSRTKFPSYFHNKCRVFFCYFPSWTDFLQYFLDIFTFIGKVFFVIFSVPNNDALLLVKF